MSCVGTMIGLPFAGERMLFVHIMSTRASICASTESGTWTAIWSPSKSALNAAQTSGCSWIALPSMSTGSNAWMPRRCSVGARFRSTGCSLDDLFEDVPDLGTLLLHHLLRALDGGDVAALFELVVDERLEQLERHLLRQAALVQLELGADDDDRTARVVDALAEQVLAEPALLALEHVGERLQRALVRAGDGLAAAAVVEQRVDRLLQHALLVADDDLRSVELLQALQAVVAVDDAAVEVVEIATSRSGRRRAERAGGDPAGCTGMTSSIIHSGLLPRLAERLDDLEALGELLALRLAGRLAHLAAELSRTSVCDVDAA